MSLELKQVSGGYGQRKVIDHLTFKIESGEVMGLIGLNGAGKSTTMKHIMGLLQPFSGTILVNGQSLREQPTSYRQALAYIPESPMLYSALTLREHLEMTALAYDIAPDVIWQRAQPLLATFRLTEHLDWFPTDFSKGMKQKVMIICAFIVDPELYIIDEPFLGLDPLGIQSMLDLMVEKRNENRTVLMSTHILATAERYCDRFIILDKGEIVAFGNLEELREQTGLKDKTLDDIYIHVTQGSSAYE